MMPLRRIVLVQGFKLFDVLTMIFCLIVAGGAIHRYAALLDNGIKETRISFSILIFLFLIVFSWHFVFNAFRLYESHRTSPRWKEIVAVLYAVFTGSVLMLLENYILKLEIFTPGVFLRFIFLSGTSTVLSRLTLRYALKKIRLRGRNLRHMLIIGTNAKAVEFAEKIRSMPECGYFIVGFMDKEWAGNNKGRRTCGWPVYRLADFRSFISENVVDEVVLSLSIKTFYNEVLEIAALCEEQGVIVKFLTNIFDKDQYSLKSEDIDGYPVTTLITRNVSSGAMVLKRLLDISISLSLLILLSPLLLIISIAVKVTSEGPVLFSQERIGLNKRHFFIHKFRTMVQDAEQKMADLEHLNEVSGPVFKIYDDPRITKIGKFLRKMSFDELPQLVNVLKGDMSLVGPRPLPDRDYKGFDKDWHRRRLSVRPGITCLWQVSGRNSVSFEKWMELDLKYIDQWSLILDLTILFKTIPAVARGSGV